MPTITVMQMFVKDWIYSCAILFFTLIAFSSCSTWINQHYFISDRQWIPSLEVAWPFIGIACLNKGNLLLINIDIHWIPILKKMQIWWSTNIVVCDRINKFSIIGPSISCYLEKVENNKLSLKNFALCTGWHHFCVFFAIEIKV